MTNVVEMASRVDKGVIKTLVIALKTLWLTRDIDTNTFSLGANVLSRMQETKQYTVNLTMTELQGEATMLNGKPFVGGVVWEFQRFIAAMQELHDYVWIHSDIRAGELEREDVHERHFTRAPEMSAWMDYTPDTPIWFRFDPNRMAEFTEAVTECKADHEKFTAKFRNIEV